MKMIGNWIAAAGLAGCLGLSTAALADGTAAPAAAPKGAAVLSTMEVTATVTKINHKTREVTLKAADGREASAAVAGAVARPGIYELRGGTSVAKHPVTIGTRSFTARTGKDRLAGRAGVDGVYVQTQAQRAPTIMVTGGHLFQLRH